jgi:hypothetical protein
MFSYQKNSTTAFIAICFVFVNVFHKNYYYGD